jgi:hypothetical protein
MSIVGKKIPECSSTRCTIPRSSRDDGFLTFARVADSSLLPRPKLVVPASPPSTSARVPCGAPAAMPTWPAWRSMFGKDRGRGLSSARRSTWSWRIRLMSQPTRRGLETHLLKRRPVVGLERGPRRASGSGSAVRVGVKPAARTRVPAAGALRNRRRPTELVAHAQRQLEIETVGIGVPDGCAHACDVVAGGWSGQRTMDDRRQRSVCRQQGGFGRDRCMGHAGGYPRTGNGKRSAVTNRVVLVVGS